jgi:DNA polymerase III alpha subunit
MRVDIYGQPILNENDLCNLYLQDPTRTLDGAFIESPIDFNDLFINLDNIPKLKQYVDPKLTVKQFDQNHQANWHMPDEYKNFDIAKFVLDQCKTEEELQRAGDELLKFHERDMFVLLQYLKFLVDMMRKHKVVWGVGRGSSVASYVLFLIGVHKINSLYYGLSIDEFLK